VDTLLLIKILYAAASIQGLFLGFMLWRTDINQPANKILSALLVLLSFHLVLIGFDEREFFMAFPHLSRISWIIGALYGPLTFLFLQRLTHVPANRILQVLIFLPFIILFIVLLPYYLQPAEAKRIYLDAFETARADDFGWVNQVVSILHIAFSVGNLTFYLWWERRQSEEYSSIDAIRVKWLRQFLVFQLVIILFGVTIFFAHIFRFDFVAGLYRYHFIGVVFLFYWLSYKALTQPVLFGIMQMPPGDSDTAPKASDEKSQKDTPDDESLGKVISSVQTVLQQEKLYLKNDLTLTELAAKSGYPRNLVSQAINNRTAGNFFDLVNQYRLDEFLKQALNPENRHLSQLGIALESGFSSKASFYAIVKKKTGMTPSAYLTKVEKDRSEV
jgi:AraC-like DNA-binding protein